MARIEVHKFGGTSVLGAQRMRSVADLLMAAASKSRIVAVASAMSGVTNELVAAEKAARKGDRHAALASVAKVREMHEKALDEIEGRSGPVRAEITAILDDLANVVGGAVVVGEVTARTRDRIVATGEKLSVRLIALILRQRGVASAAIDADTFIDTDANYSDANPLPFVTDRGIASTLMPRLEKGEIPIVTGFMGRAPDGSTTTFSRGGSDYSCTLIAGALNADEATIWTDVDGVYTTDPRIVPGAGLIPQLNYREAGEMSYYGAKVLHQRTMIPVAAKRIPVLVRNTLNPVAPGTVVDGRSAIGVSSQPVKAVTAIKDQALLSVEGKGMSGVPGVAARLFGALAAKNISVTMISQSSSESSVCLAVPGTDATEAEKAIKREFRDDISRGDIEDVAVRLNVALVAAVGLGMAHTPGVAGGVFGALGADGVNVLAIAQGSSELNITLAVDQAEVDQAIVSIHERFGLGATRAAARRTRADLIILGPGQVGRALLQLIMARRQRGGGTGTDLRVVGIADRSGYVRDAAGLNDSALDQVIEAKKGKRELASLAGATASASDSYRAVLDAVAEAHPSHPILVDVTDSPGTAPLITDALSRGFDVVTANKRPLAVPFAQFGAIRAAAAAAGRSLGAEATVGAGLPVIDTLRMLIETGDTVRKIEGCFSGTLGFIMSELEAGTTLSDAVQQAIAKGYTEPDPVVDLSGGDVARKAVILSRFAGMSSSDEAISLTGLVEAGLLGCPLEALHVRLRALDAEMTTRVRRARDNGAVVRYVATVERGSIEVGLRDVPSDSPLGGLRGTDNMIVFHTGRYSNRPLVIAGPGAGAEVTAMAVLTDILRANAGGEGRRP